MPIPGLSTSPSPPAPRPAPEAARAPARPEDQFEPAAGLAACIFPGAGHFLLGERRRAALIAAGVLGMFFGGLLIGGIDVIDRKEDPIWFLGQALVGPVAFGVDHLHQNRFKVNDQGRLRSARPDEARDARGNAVPAAPGQRPPNSKSLGRMNELGTLSATLAGMLNLIAIIDALLHTRRRPEKEAAR